MKSFLAGSAALLLGIGASSAQIVQNGSFENPNIGTGFQEGIPATGWTLVPGSQATYGGGLVANGSAYAPPPAPDGTQAALLKGDGGMSQSDTFTAGSFVLTFQAAGRNANFGPNPFDVTIDGTLLTFTGTGAAGSTITPVQQVYNTYTSAPFTETAGAHTIAFDSTLVSPGPDLSSFVDVVAVNSVPEPGTIAAILGGAGMLLGLRRRRS